MDIDRLRLFWSFPLAHVAERFGNLVALKVADAVGGRSVYIPCEPDAAHPIARAAGLDVLTFLMGLQHIERGTSYTMPVAALARRQIVERRAEFLLARGLSISQIAVALHLHVRSAYRMAARIRAGTFTKARVPLKTGGAARLPNPKEALP